MKLEEAIEIVLKGARAMKEDEAANVVEDFFVNNVFDGTED
jgi:hypothetical protein